MDTSHEPTAPARLMTYNIHRCVGLDGKHSPERIAETIRESDPDIVALQEVEVGHVRTARMDQPRVLAEKLGMQFLYHPARERREERFGNAILSRLPLRSVRTALLPTLPRFAVQRRAAVWAAVEVRGVQLQVINTHLGLVRGERMLQALDLCGTDWLTHPECSHPRVLCGDFNATPRSRVHKVLNGTLRDAQELYDGESHPTWPSLWPFVRYDHVFVSREIEVRRVHVPRTKLTRIASDHLPVVMEFHVEGNGKP
jgi:endonuclease/exonuclease/phosphatase family metal-dependent hydrolase